MRFVIQITTLEDAGEGSHGAAIACLSTVRRMLKTGARSSEQQYCDSAIRLTVAEDDDDPLEPYCDVCGEHGASLRTPVEVCRDCYDIAKYGQEMLAAYGLKENHLSSPLLRVHVRTMREVEPREFSFDRNRTASSCAETVALACGYPPGDACTLAKDGFALPYERTLLAAGVSSGDVLDLVIVGGGV